MEISIFGIDIEHIEIKLLCYAFAVGMLFWFTKNMIKTMPDGASTWWLYFVIGIVAGIPVCHFIVNAVADR